MCYYNNAVDCTTLIRTVLTDNGWCCQINVQEINDLYGMIPTYGEVSGNSPKIPPVSDQHFWHFNSVIQASMWLWTCRRTTTLCPVGMERGCRSVRTWTMHVCTRTCLTYVCAFRWLSALPTPTRRCWTGRRSWLRAPRITYRWDSRQPSPLKMPLRKVQRSASSL